MLKRNELNEKNAKSRPLIELAYLPNIFFSISSNIFSSIGIAQHISYAQANLIDESDHVWLDQSWTVGVHARHGERERAVQWDINLKKQCKVSKVRSRHNVFWKLFGLIYTRIDSTDEGRCNMMSLFRKTLENLCGKRFLEKPPGNVDLPLIMKLLMYQ